MKTRLAVLVPLVALLACRADNNASVLMAGVCAPPDTCSFGATCDHVTLDSIRMDLAAAPSLWLFVEVHNQMPDNSNTGINKTNTNDAFVQEYEVEYVGAPLPTGRGSIFGSGRVPADGTTVISLLAVNESVKAAIDALVPTGSLDIVAKLRLKGQLADTSSFTTGVMEIPIHVCRGGCIPAVACTSGALPVFCPQGGQRPASVACPQ